MEKLSDREPNKTLTLVVDDLFFNKLVFVWEWDFVSVGAVVVVVVVPDVTWSAGNDSGTVCSVGLIVADIFDKLGRFEFSSFAFYNKLKIRRLWFIRKLISWISLSTLWVLHTKYECCCCFERKEKQNSVNELFLRRNKRANNHCTFSFLQKRSVIMPFSFLSYKYIEHTRTLFYI